MDTFPIRLWIMQSPFALSFLLVDLPQAIRSLRKNPAYAVTVVLTLSLAIGANSTIFTLASAFLLSHLPVVHPERLFQVITVDPESGKGNLSIPAFQALQANTSVFSSVLAWNGGGVENLETNGMHFVGSVDEVVGDYYATLGVQPALGRHAAAPQKNPELGLFLRRGIQLRPAATGISYLRERFTQPLHRVWPLRT
jgi:hypothetical protein